METVLEILIQVGGLVGVAAAIAAIINAGKTVGLIKDGDSGAWSALLNLIALAVLVSLKLYRPDISLEEVDVQVGAFAQIIGLLLSFIVQIKFSKLAHEELSDAGVPVVGKSFSLELFDEVFAIEEAEEEESAE